MLTQEKMAKFQVIMAQGGQPSPEDSADFELYKAMINSQAIAGAAVQPQAQSMAQVLTPVSAPVPVATVPVASVPAATMPTALTPTNGSAFSMDDLMSQSLVADSFLKVKYQQTFINQSVVNAPEIYVAIDMNAVTPKMSIKGGQPVKYASTVDGQTCTTGGSWMEAVADIQKLDPKARPYNCVDLPMTVVKDILAYDGSVVAPKGTVLGHTTATTNWKGYVEFYRSLPDKSAVVFVKITRKDISKNSQNWALLDFEYIPDEDAARLGLSLA